MTIAIVVIIMLVLFGGLGIGAEWLAGRGDLQQQASRRRRFVLDDVQLTHYWIKILRPGTRPVYDLSGRVLAYVDEGDYRDLLIEGTGQLPDGTRINWTDGKRWRVLPAGSEGLGVGGRKLMSMQSIAVDPKVIPYDSIVYIRELGSWHLAVDTGDAIRGCHIDYFVGLEGTRTNHPSRVNLDVYPP